MEGEAEERGRGSEGRVMGKERIAWRDAKGKIKGLPMFSLSFSLSLSLSLTHSLIGQSGSILFLAGRPGPTTIEKERVIARSITG